MTLETFEQIIEKQRELERRVSAALDLKIDLLDFVDEYSEISRLLLIEIYGKEGYYWYTWFCYEHDYGEKKSIGAWDKDKNPICYDIKSTWEFLEQLKKESELL